MELLALWLTLLTSTPTQYSGLAAHPIWTEGDTATIELTPAREERARAAFGSPLTIAAVKGYAGKREGWFFARKMRDDVGLLLEIRRRQGLIALNWWTIGPADPSRWKDRQKIDATLLQILGEP